VIELLVPFAQRIETQPAEYVRSVEPIQLYAAGCPPPDHAPVQVLPPGTRFRIERMQLECVCDDGEDPLLISATYMDKGQERTIHIDGGEEELRRRFRIVARLVR
jgi:hypothetical protein